MDLPSFTSTPNLSELIDTIMITDRLPVVSRARSMSQSPLARAIESNRVLLQQHFAERYELTTVTAIHRRQMHSKGRSN